MSTPLITFEQWRLRTVMPPESVDALEMRRPGYVAARLALRTTEIHARLAKRYAVPFASPAPDVACMWLEQIVTGDAYEALGYAPGAHDERIIEAAKAAQEALKEAANSEVGLYELPLRADLASSDGVERGGPLFYAEQSPYEWTDAQVAAVRGTS